MSLEAYLKELETKAQKPDLDDLSVSDLAKLAGVKLSESLCPECGGQLSKSGTMVKCSCGYSKLAAKMSLERREALPAKQFAVPETKAKKIGVSGEIKGEAKGKYPIPDVKHARNALARVSQHGTPAERQAVRSKVYGKFPQLKVGFEERHGQSPTAPKNIKKVEQGGIGKIGKVLPPALKSSSELAAGPFARRAIGGAAGGALLGLGGYGLYRLLKPKEKTGSVAHEKQAEKKLHPTLAANAMKVKAVQDPAKPGAEMAPPSLLKKSAISKIARDMPHFTEQDRPEKVKDIYRALKREHPGMPAEMKARIAARQGKPGKQKQGPPYKGPLTKSSALSQILKLAEVQGEEPIPSTETEKKVPSSMLETNANQSIPKPATHGALPTNENDPLYTKQGAIRRITKEEGATRYLPTAGLAAGSLGAGLGTAALMSKLFPPMAGVPGGLLGARVRPVPVGRMLGVVAPSIAAAILGGAGGTAAGVKLREAMLPKTSSWNRTIQKLAQDVSPEEMQGQLMEGDPETMRRQYGTAGAVGGSILGSLAGLPLLSRLPGAGKLLGLAPAAVGGIAGGLLGARAGEAEAGREAALQEALYNTGLQEGAMLGAQALQNQLFGGGEGMNVQASINPETDLKKADRPDSEFDPGELARGIEIEKEHTDNPAAAKGITKGHLSEIEDYNTRLDSMEEQAKAEGAKKEGQAHPFDKSAGLAEIVQWMRSRPELIGGLIGGTGGAGIGALTAEEGNIPRRALVGGLTGATLGGLGGAFGRELGLGSEIAHQRGVEEGIFKGFQKGYEHLKSQPEVMNKELQKALQNREAVISGMKQEAQAAEQAQQAAQQTPVAPAVGTMAPEGRR